MITITGFNGTYSGLTSDQINTSRKNHGRNELIVENKISFFLRIVHVFNEPMFILLFLTALLYFFLGEISDGILMLVFVSFILGINHYQKNRTAKALEALKNLSTPKVNVIRNNHLESIDSAELVVSDLMLLEEGNKIVADGRILEMYDLGIDESTLTGESRTVWKKQLVENNENNNYWRENYCYAGTTVVQGRAIVEVTSVGSRTKYGKIGIDILSVPHQLTPLEKATRRLINICAIIGLIISLSVLLITYTNTQNITESVLAGITAAMALIPEEFPVILTVFLAMGAWRLAKNNALIRKIPAVETLGSVSVLCVDKTGTLTKNQMTVQELYSQKDIKNEDLSYWAALACEPEPFDPMEKAILEYADSKGIHKESLFDKVLVSEYSFSTEKKMMGHIWKVMGENCLAAKGAPESILPLCQLSTDEMKILAIQQELMAQKGYRIIAVAIQKDMKSIPKTLEENKLNFLGFIALMDPPREAVPDAIKRCNEAGIRIIIITGDYGTTAQCIAKKIGVNHSENIITGAQLDKMSDEALNEQLKVTNIFSRVMPEHKTRIIKALKNSGEIVAMTGDGVNDASALKYADIGIAMGKRGTDVAKEAADIILLDDNFTTIVDTIKDGRRIYDNIKKAIGYVFTIHIPIVLITLLAPLFDLPLLLLPIHIVLLQFLIDPTCSIIFERNLAEKDIMLRGPRSPQEPLINRGLIVKAILQGLSIFAATFGAYYLFYLQTKQSLLTQGFNVDQLLLTLKGIDLQNFLFILTGNSRTIALLILVFCNLFLVYVNQSEKECAIINMVKYNDKITWLVNISIITAMMLLIYTPYANTIAQIHPLNIYEVLLSLGIAAAATFWWEVVKVIKRR